MPESFPDALSRAIAARHATLDSLARQLRELGTPVSMATLSYWQTGRSVPSRSSSLKALANLEGLLQLAPGALSRALAGIDDEPEEPDEEEDKLQQALAGMGMALDRGLAKLMVHDTHFVDEVPGQERRVTRQLMRAISHDVVRLPVVTTNDPAGSVGPTVEALDGCRIGQVTRLEEFGVSVVEVLLDRPLLRGFETQISYQTTWPTDEVPTSFNRWFRHPVHYLVLEARFAKQLPREAHYQLEATPDAPSEPIPLSVGPSVQFVGHNLAAGTHNLHWTF